MDINNKEEINHLNKIKLVIISVGGTPSPIIYLLNFIKPKYIIFFASIQSNKTLSQDILDKLEFKPEYIDLIITQSSEDLLICYKKLQEELFEKLNKIKLLDNNINPKEIVVDYTGGTKTMSVALSLATIDYGFNYTYIGGLERAKGGLGVVIDGKERLIYINNPYEIYGVNIDREIEINFNNLRFDNVLNLINENINKLTDYKKILYTIIHTITIGYKNWDNFKHQNGRINIEKGFNDFKKYCAKDSRYKTLLESIERNLIFLRNLESNKDEYKIYDLIGNAMRRSYIECRYDDALARIYRAFEKKAQIEIYNELKFRNSKIPIDRFDKIELISNEIKEKFKKKYIDEKEDALKLPLYASYELLYYLNNDYGVRFINNYDEIHKILNRRNMSILAHGEEPIDENVFNDALNFIIKFLNIDRSIIPEFPKLEIYF